MSFAKERTVEWTKHIKDTCRLCKTGKGCIEKNRFCYVCKDTFCESHVDDHNCLGHSETVYILQVDKAHTVTQKLLCCRRVVCKCNNISPVAVYCYAEKDVICKGCHMQLHKGHKTVSIVKKCASYKKVNLSALVEKVKKLTEENNQILKARQSQITSFITVNKNAQRTIHSFSADIIKHFGLKDQAILQDSEIHAAEYKQAMELHVEMCTNLEKCLRNDLDCLNDIQSHSFKPDMFAADLIISRRLASAERDLNYMQSPSLTFRRGEHLISLITMIRTHAGSSKEADRESPKAAGSNGEESVFSETKQDNDQTRTEVNVVHPRCKRQNIKHKFVFPRQKIDRDADERDTDVLGCAIMPDDKIVLVVTDKPCFALRCKGEKEYMYVVLLDKSFDFLSRLELHSRPDDISAANETSAIITLPEEKQLQYIKVESGQLKPGRILQMDNSYYDVEVARKTIYATCVEDYDESSDTSEKSFTFSDFVSEIRILDMDGNVLKCISSYKDGDQEVRLCGSCCYLHFLSVDASAERIFFNNCYSGGKVTCLKFNGTVVFHYQHPKMKYPSEVCVCNDNGYAILASGCVHIVSNDGKLRDIIYIVDNFNNKIYHCSIAYRKQTDTLVLSHHTAGKYCFDLNRWKSYRWWSYLC